MTDAAPLVRHRVDALRPPRPCPTNIVAYAAIVATAAPIIPYGGIRIRLSAMLTTAAAPVTTQLNCVRRARPTPIATTMYPANATAENASGPTTRDDSAKAGAAIQSHDPGREQREAGRDPGRDDHEVRQDVRVRPPRLARRRRSSRRTRATRAGTRSAAAPSPTRCVRRRSRGRPRSVSASLTRKSRSLKFVIQRKSAVGTSGSPKRFISRRRRGRTGGRAARAGSRRGR